MNNTVFKGKILNVSVGKYNNIGFPYYDDEDRIAGYEICNKQYKQMVEGSKRSSSVWHSNIQDILDFVLLTESPIDALSYHQLKGKKNTLYVAFAGAVEDEQVTTLKTIIKRTNSSPDFKFISAVDNDDAGRKYIEKFKVLFGERLIIEVPLLKDFNEDLKKSQVLIKGLKI